MEVFCGVKQRVGDSNDRSFFDDLKVALLDQVVVDFLRDLLDEIVHGGLTGCSRGIELQATRGLLVVTSVESDDVQVYIKVYGRSKPLDKAHKASFSVLNAAF